MRISVLTVLCLAAAFRAGASDAVPLPESSLYTTQKTYCVEFHQSNLSPDGRREAAELVQVIVNEMMDRGCTVFLSRAFLQEEIDYHRKFGTNGTNVVLGKKLATALNESLEKGEIDWQRLRQIHSEAADTEIISRAFPWLYPWRGAIPPRLAPESSPWPKLRLTLDWEGARARGVAQVRTSSYIGHTTLWKADCHLSFQTATGNVTRHYPAPAWVEEYYGQDSRPVAILMTQIINDLKRGLKAPPAPPPPPTSRRPDAGKKKRSAVP